MSHYCAKCVGVREGEDAEAISQPAADKNDRYSVYEQVLRTRKAVADPGTLSSC